MWDPICYISLLRWILLGTFLHRIATIAWVASWDNGSPNDNASFLLPPFENEARIPTPTFRGINAKSLWMDSSDSPDSSARYVRFGGRTLQMSDEPPISSVHCLGETFNETRSNTPGALYRSCRYDNMCYHINQKRMVLFPSQQHWKLISRLHPNIYLSTVSKAVMTSAVVQATPEQTPMAMPQYRNHSRDNRYYYAMKADDDTIWIPIEPASCESIFWDVFLPVYTLVEIFDFLDKPWRLLLLGEATCTRDQLQEYFDLMGLSKNDIEYFPDDLRLSNHGHQEFVCYQRTVMGIGAYADHQVIRPTTNLTKRQLRHIPPNHIRRETNLRGFRQHCLSKLNLTPRRAKPYIVAYSPMLADDWIPLSIPATTQKVMLSPLASLREQIHVTSKTSILVLASDEDKTAAFFLPEGATLILIGEAQEDWDLWSNNALLRVHLVTTRIQEVVEHLILDELGRLDQQEAKTFTSRGDENQIDFVNNRSVTLVQASPPITRVHCVGEKRFPNILGAEQYRSCHYENLCFDMTSKSFVIFPSPFIQQVVNSNGSSLEEGNYFSSIPRSLVASPQPSKLGAGYFSDVPVTRSRVNVSSYYLLEGAWLGTKTFNTNNIGHTLWDGWLPFFTLLEMFGLSEEQLFVTRYPSLADASLINREIEMLFGFTSRTTHNDELTVSDAQSKYICATHGASGFGWLTDHGVSDHGWRPQDYEYPVNLGRGPELRRWRRYMLTNVRIPFNTKLQSPYLITFSINSSHTPSRRIDFREEIAAVANLPNIQLEDGRHLAELSILEQITIASRTAIYISVVGGGTFPAYFLPQGATLILYGDKDMYLDFDLFNNYGQVRVHWMSLSARQNNTELLLELIRDELEVMTRSHS